MPRIIPAQIEAEIYKQGYKPRVGITLDALLKSYSCHTSFQIRTFSGTSYGAFVSVGGSFTDNTKNFTDLKIFPNDIVIITEASDIAMIKSWTILSKLGDHTLFLDGLDVYAGEEIVEYYILKNFHDQVKDQPKISISVSRFGGLAQMQQVSFSIYTEGELSGYVAGGQGFEDTNGEIHLFMDDGTEMMWDERLMIFKGFIDDFPRMNIDSMHINLTDFSYKYQEKVIGNSPEAIEFERDNTDGITVNGLSEIPPDSMKFINPLAYGDFVSAMVKDRDHNATAMSIDQNLSNKDHSFTPAINLGDNFWKIADHEITQLSEIDSDYAVLYAWDDNIKSFVEVEEFTVIENDDVNGCIVRVIQSEIPGETISTFAYYLEAKLLIPMDPGNWDNYDTVFDDPLNSAKAEAPSTLGIGLNYYVVFPVIKLDSTLITEIEHYVDYQSWNGESLGYHTGAIGWNSHTSRYMEAGTGTLNWTQKRNTWEAYTIECAFFDIIEGEFVRVYRHVAKVRYQPEEEKPIFFGGLGKPYPAWIGSRGSHAFGGSTGLQITEPGSIIEDFLRNDVFGLNLGDDEINIDSFDGVSVARSSWKCIQSLIDKNINVYQFLDSLALNSSILIYFDSENKWSVKAFDASAGFSATNYIFSHDTGTTAGKFDNHPIAENSLTIERISQDFFNDLKIRYAPHFELNEMQNLKEISDTSIFSEIKTQEITNDNIIDPDTMDLYSAILIHQKALRPFKVNFKTFLNGLEVELWDVINIRHPRISQLFSPLETHKKWLVTRLDYDFSSMEIEITAIEL